MRLFRLPATNNRETSPSFPCHLKLQNDLVGMDLRLEEMNSCISIGSDGVRIVGIYGMGGIGKTTIAKTYYNLMSCQYEGRAFLADVREVCSKGGLLSLQEQLLRDILMNNLRDILMEKHVKIWNAYRGMVMIKNRLRFRRVLIVIDDVDQLYQLQNLAGMKYWFGLGSRIIITTRDEHLLMSHGVDTIYKAKELNNTEALQLFILKAFKDSGPPKDYVPLSSKFVNYANGLPLALEVLGSFLFGKTLNEWRASLNRLKENPENEILDTLQISFDGLEETERQIFLDIACFFKGKNEDHVTKILDTCGLYPDIGIRVLIEKSLITIVGKRLWMHDLLQEMGWKLVRQESPKEPGKRSRLWLYEDIFHVKSKNTVRVLKPIVSMKNLRLLIFHNLHFSQNLEYLSSELRFLEWHGYPCKTFPPTFQSKQLFELNLCFSQVEQLWDGIKQLNNLKVMKLSHSRNLVKTPDFRGVPNLEELILEGCTRLYEIDRSIGVLQTLVLLNLKDCKRLVSLPEGIYGLKALKIFNISGCSKLDYMLEELGHVECLEELDISGTAIKQTSHSSFHFKNLKILSLNGCNGQSKPLLSILPEKSSHSSAFCSLMVLDLSNCNLQEETVPKNLSCLSSLREISFRGNNFISLPASIIGLSNLQRLHLDNCRRLESLQPFPSNVQLISAHGCSSLETLPEDPDTYSLQSLQLNFANCFKLSRNQGDNNLAFMMLRRYLQGLSNPKTGFDIVIPGSNVPKWFSHQSSGDSSARLELPPICSDSKWMGFALCAIFVIRNRADPSILDFDLGCSIKIKGHTWPHHLEDGFLTSMEQFGSDQLWLFYLSRHEFLEIDWHETTQISCPVEVKFTAHGMGFSVKKFGVRLVYEQDVLEFNRTSNQFRISNYENCDAVHKVLDISEMDGALVKRSYSDHIKSDEAESSGISNLDIEPQTKE
ncbi:LOW QUALITY PROTEIN: disease resistance protein RUN1 [Jatropha curcas]|uniref:LOW QUALITY PROTEIN: disease resistance protein RUN1 n=1 Tax=Jatropha curcas TaxID=180498 RepID=UPI0018963B98|nr:LOW QUALITY PROTEIN: disease resistance protein RUN1 [Jatropha curcas]